MDHFCVTVNIYSSGISLRSPGPSSQESWETDSTNSSLVRILDTSELGHLCYCSVAKSCLTLYDPMDCSMPGFPVLHYLLEFAQAHVHWVSDAIWLSHHLLPSSPFAFNLSQHQGLFPLSWLFASSGQSIGASAIASVLPMTSQGCILLTVHCKPTQILNLFSE